MESERFREAYLEKRITRRQAIKTGGIAALGLVFCKPLIETIRPPSVWAGVSPCLCPPPHPPGDFSVDVFGDDFKDGGYPWEYTKYYYVTHNPCTPVTQLKVQVDRFLPGLSHDGAPSLVHTGNGVISEYARLRIAAIDVPAGGVPVSINNIYIGNLGAATKTKEKCIYEFRDVSILSINLANKRKLDNGKPTGSRPDPADNIIEFGFGSEEVKIVWVELSFDVMSPYILIHGKGANRHFWRGFPAKSGTDERDKILPCWSGLADELEESLIPFDESISLGVDPWNRQNSQESIIDQAAELDNHIPSIVRSFGTRHFNIIAHSKGGLDARLWVTNRKNANSPDIVLGQFITIATPHMGSVVADYAIAATKLSKTGRYQALIDAERIHPAIRTLIIAPYLGKLFGANPATPATVDLQTTNMKRFNDTNMKDLANHKNKLDRTRPTFLAIRSDADSDNPPDHAADDPDEWHTAICYEGVIFGTFSNAAYQALYRVETAQLLAGGFLLQAQHSDNTRQPNDLLVSFESAFPESVSGSPFQLVGTFKGKDHGSVADRETSAFLRATNAIQDLK